MSKCRGAGTDSTCMAGVWRKAAAGRRRRRLRASSKSCSRDSPRSAAPSSDAMRLSDRSLHTRTHSNGLSILEAKSIISVNYQYYL
jgi:hypothetical protein